MFGRKRRDKKSDVGADAGLLAVEGGCCLLQALTVLALVSFPTALLLTLR